MKTSDFFRNSPMRESILNWYPFRAGASVSRLGTEVSSGNEKYDYVSVIDPSSFEIDELKRYRGLLKPHGRLLLAYENRFGLRYWCGKRSPATGLPFDRIIGGDGVPGKSELSRRLISAGFGGQKWYYPMSDHRFAEDIFSENYLPKNYSVARFRPYVERDYTLLMNEQSLYKDIIQNGVFEFFANAYLVEARLCGEDKPCCVDYAAVTTYRKPENRFATLVCDDGKVRKLPLHPDGIAGIRRLAKNHSKLAALGVNVVPVELEDNCAVMPRIDCETLIDYWQRKQQEDALDLSEVSSVLERIRGVILSSSGPVVFPELVPANCFYYPETGKLLFFDQESSIEGWPVEAALTRLVLSLAHSTLFSYPGVPELFESLKIRYGLAEKWEIWVRMEREFVHSVLNHAETVPITRLRDVDESMIVQNVNAVEQTLRRRRLIPVLKAIGGRFAVYGYGKRGRELCALLSSLPDTDVLFVVDKYPPPPITRRVNQDI